MLGVYLRHHVNFKGPLSRLVCSRPHANFSNFLVLHLVDSFLGARVLKPKYMLLNVCRRVQPLVPQLHDRGNAAKAAVKDDAAARLI